MSIRELLQALPSVVTRRLGARDGFYTAGRMFALVGEGRIWLRLPGPETAALVEADRVEPLVARAIPSHLAWAAIELAQTDPTEVHDLILKAHDAVRLARRRFRSGRTLRRRPRTPA